MICSALSPRLERVGIFESLVALLHDLRFGVGEVRFSLVLGRSGSIGFLPRRLRPSASRLACSSSRRRCSSSPGRRPRLPTRFRLPDLGKVLTPLQFVGQFVATTASQRMVLLGVELLGLLEQLLDLSFQPLDFLVHVAVTHRLVPRGVRSHLRPCRWTGSKLDHTHLAARQGLRNRVRNAARWILRKSLIVRKSGGSSPTTARKARFARRRPPPFGWSRSHGVGVDQERDHHGHVERRSPRSSRA